MTTPRPGTGRASSTTTLYARERLLLIAEEAASIVAELAPDLRVEIDSSALAATFERLAVRLGAGPP